MKAVIVTIGDEILLGQILDTNSRFIARELAKLGAETVQMSSVADEKQAIWQALDSAFSVADAVFVTGGLGPTKDDLTKTVLAQYFGTELVFHPQAYAWLEEMFAAYPQRMNAYNQSQAMLPKSCTPLRNLKGTASGMWFEKDGKVLVSLPGVPFEAEYLFAAEVLPKLKEKFHHLLLQYRMVTVYNIPEAELAMKLEEYEKVLPEGISLAYLPSESYVRLRLTAKGRAVKELSGCWNTLLDCLRELDFKELHMENSEQEIASLFSRYQTTIACAESCTGGNIARLITQVAGASNYFLGGVVAYANEVKKNVLGVREEDLNKYGAVSEAVALQMAQGVRRITGAKWAVATTGVAGPQGGTPEKPVGTVWIAVAGPQGSKAEKFLFSHTRERNIAKSSLKALQLLLEEIEKNHPTN